jgi:heme-degrading monooxygenase HmoA
MTFIPSEVDPFLQLFHTTKQQIRHFEGCKRLELLKDVNQPTVFFTYSWWDSEEHLNKYRFSDLFKNIWSQTKIKFSDKPQAWSLVNETIV